MHGSPHYKAVTTMSHRSGFATPNPVRCTENSFSGIRFLVDPGLREGQTLRGEAAL